MHGNLIDFQPGALVDTRTMGIRYAIEEAAVEHS